MFGNSAPAECSAGRHARVATVLVHHPQSYARVATALAHHPQSQVYLHRFHLIPLDILRPHEASPPSTLLAQYLSSPFLCSLFRNPHPILMKLSSFLLPYLFPVIFSTIDPWEWVSSFVFFCFSLSYPRQYTMDRRG